MTELRDWIAKVIWKTFQNTPPIEATDEEWESWWDESGESGQRLFYDMADAAIVEMEARR